MQGSHCRFCQHYCPVGRRGGECQRLDVPVKGQWSACSLMMPSFAPSWEMPENVIPMPVHALPFEYEIAVREREQDLVVA
ncbi:hypothetical protein GS597_14855 [Synechococcales cyanobacterium C]|uniref:Uncharacterized protein n=1 Tax=Petrachloros mirabilis ULC683 TaxID=2781853 RepID=A0A8K2A186_9CYAN|nr:hypothetical protein [Petrachloros mirabilis]NCJ07766.1 hypothetical protein [Petrachloros mirabilis ULC683]